MSAVAEMLPLPQEAGAHFSSFLNHAPIGLALCDRCGRITISNRAFEELLGVEPGKARHALTELMRSDEDDKTENLIKALFGGERTSFQVESSTRGAAERLLRWTVWTLHGNGQEPECASVMVEDLTAVAIERQRLHQAERLESIGRLAGGVAHDFNNLLTGVLLYCDLLMSAIEPGHRARKYAEEIRAAGLNATNLVRQLLSVARSNKSAPRPVSLNEIAEGMKNLLARLIGEKIQLQLRLAPDLCLVRMDPGQAQQVLLNLVLNARDALPRGGQISVRTSNCRVQVLSQPVFHGDESAFVPCALFAVEDNGEGMDESVRAQVFEPFFTTKPGKGTGIGLATVHDIVSSSGGLIHVWSERNRGTRISVLLPLIPESLSIADPNPSFHPNHNGEVLSFQSEEATP